MTTTVKIEAHCDVNEHVLVDITNDYGVEEESFFLENGETAERYVYNDRKITVREMIK